MEGRHARRVVTTLLVNLCVVRLGVDADNNLLRLDWVGEIGFYDAHPLLS